MINNKFNIVIFIASIIVGVLISSNIDFDKGKSKPILTAEEYQNAYNKRSELYNDISKLKENNLEISNKIEEYSEDDEANKNILKKIKEELKVNMMLSGIEDTTGQGIKIIMKDGTESFQGEVVNDFLLMYRTIHDDDMINVVNELKAAGAEAISINNQRVIFNSEIYCGGQFLRLNAVKVPAPFYINVIGDPERLESYLLSEDSFITSLKNREIQVEIIKSDEVLVPEYIGDINIRYMSIYEK